VGFLHVRGSRFGTTIGELQSMGSVVVVPLFSLHMQSFILKAFGLQ